MLIRLINSFRFMKKENNIRFDFFIDKKDLHLGNGLAWSELRYFFTGEIKLSIGTECLVIDQDILDNLVQLDFVINSIEEGEYSLNTFSQDCYSNLIFYEFNPKSRRLRIEEVNGSGFDCLVDYNEFKKSYIRFRSVVINEMLLCFPVLESYKDFMSWIRKM